MFVGREPELSKLSNLILKDTASLVVVKGRRRIGKSRLVDEFGKSFSKYYKFAGLPPTENLAGIDQKKEFKNQFEQQFKVPGIDCSDWSHLFYHLAAQTRKGKVLILIDEISWMGDQDRTFLGKLKSAWDLHFKTNQQLILVLCSSVSSWVEKNILSSTGFMGRISLEISLSELPINACLKFWKKTSKRISVYEKLKVLSVTGGVPRYLEEITASVSAEENIKRLCFQAEGILVNEFDRLFSDLFDNRSMLYQKIIRILINGTASFNEICQKLKLQKSGVVSQYMEDLIQARFILKYSSWSIKKRQLTKLYKYRISDNYIRFYLKYVDPIKELIQKGHFNFKSVYSLSNWESIMGLQFENLVVNNIGFLFPYIGIHVDNILFEGPYFQKQTKHKTGCQIDYLIQDRFNTLYIIELKFSKGDIPATVIENMKRKIKALDAPKNISIRPVLIYVGTISDSIKYHPIFDRVISFEDILDEQRNTYDY